MTHEPGSPTRSLWPMVCIFGMGLAAIVIILLFAPAENGAAQSVTAIVGLLGSILSAAYVSQRVAEVNKNVNGRMSELIARVPEKETPE